MRAVVTGGAGFLGSHIVDAFKARGAEVLVIDDLSSGKRENLPPGVELLAADIRSIEALSRIVDFKADVLIHAAAQISVRKSMENPGLDADINVTALLRIIQELKSGDLPYMVFISTGGALYDSRAELPWKESSPIAPMSVYGASKRAAELYLDVWRNLYKLKFASLRPANIYGPRQNPHGEAGVCAIFNEAILKGETPAIFGTGEQTRDYVYVSDVVDAVVRAVDIKYEGVCNLGTGIETSVNMLLGCVAKAHGVEAAPKLFPARPGELERSCLDASRAKKELGWEPRIDFAEGIERTCRWFIERT